MFSLKNDLRNLYKKFKNSKKVYKIFIFLILFSLIFLIFLLFLITTGCQLINTLESDYDITNIDKINKNDIEGYNRPEESTYLTFPEWHLVYISDDYTNWIKYNPPSSFPYFSSMKQYWQGYCNVHIITKDRYGFNFENHLMLMVIGISTNLEYSLKGIYEKSIGRLTELISSVKTEEDKFAYEYNYKYSKFLYDLPWYKYPYLNELKLLWKETSYIDNNMIRKYERKFVLSIELILKSIYGEIIEVATKSVLGTADLYVYATIETKDINFLKNYSRIELIKEVSNHNFIIKIPRYRQFTEIMLEFSKENVTFIDISGNKIIFLTVIAPINWKYNLEEGSQTFEMKLLINEDKKRIGISTSVKSLNKIILRLKDQGIFVEHIYDY